MLSFRVIETTSVLHTGQNTLALNDATHGGRPGVPPLRLPYVTSAGPIGIAALASHGSRCRRAGGRASRMAARHAPALRSHRGDAPQQSFYHLLHGRACTGDHHRGPRVTLCLVCRPPHALMEWLPPTPALRLLCRRPLWSQLVCHGTGTPERRIRRLSSSLGDGLSAAAAV